MTEYVRITDRKIELTDEGVEALMTDYTPTTEEVRYKYSWWTDKNLVARGLEPTDTLAEFDRWLAEVKAQAWEEGYAHGNADAFTEARRDRDNPYRQGEGQ